MTDFQRGNRLYAEKRYKEAVEAFVRHARDYPAEAASAFANAAKCCVHINVLPAPSVVARGVTLISQGDRQSEERYYRAALEADGQHSQSLRGLAFVLPDKSPERLSLLERAAALRADILVLISLGDYYRSVLKDLQKARETYRRAQEAHPNDQTAYLRLNDICRRLGLPDEAKAWSQRWRERRE